MFKEKELSIPNQIYEKHATIYYDTDIPPKACILYFHGGGLLYGTRTDLPELHRDIRLSLSTTRWLRRQSWI